MLPESRKTAVARSERQVCRQTTITVTRFCVRTRCQQGSGDCQAVRLLDGPRRAVGATTDRCRVPAVERHDSWLPLYAQQREWRATCDVDGARVCPVSQEQPHNCDVAAQADSTAEGRVEVMVQEGAAGGFRVGLQCLARQFQRVGPKRSK